MKKYVLPFTILFSWIFTSCSSEDNVIADIDQDFSSWTVDGVPIWLSDRFTDISIDHLDLHEKYLLSSNGADVMFEWNVAKIHELDSKQYVSLSIGYGTERPSTLIAPVRLPDKETVIYTDPSTDVRKLGYYDLIAACYTPEGQEIRDQQLTQRIMSSPGRIIHCYQYGACVQHADRIYGFEDSEEFIKPYFYDKLQSMCNERFNQYGESFFWGSIKYYTVIYESENENENESHIIHREVVTDEHTDGKGYPFALITYIMNEDQTLTRHIESFIATEDGSINQLPFDEVKEIMSSQFGYTDYNPFSMLCAIRNPQTLLMK